VNPLIIDIETGPLSRPELAEFVPTFEAPSNWKDAEKIRAYVAEKEADWFQSAALSAVTGRVLAIGYLDTRNEEIGFFATGDERADLTAFWQHVAPGGLLATALVGFCSNRFDVPFLIRRSWRLSVPVPRAFTGGRFLPHECIDIVDTWRCGVRDDSISLDTLARFLGVGRKTGKGADFAALWSTDRAAALEYLTNDLRLTRECAETLGLTPAPTTSNLKLNL